MVREMDFVDECYADKDLSLLKKLTLVIPTYNRNYYLSRCLWYHAHFPFGQIIVADSSPEEKKVVNRETVAKIREMFGADILYLEYEPETEKYGGDIYRKWSDAVQRVVTEYSQICTDKEFTIPSSIQNSLKYLEEHDDYICADGRYYIIRDPASPRINVWRPSQKSINDDTKYSRFAAYTRYSDPLMAVHRSLIHKQIYSELDGSGLETLGFKERFIDVYTFILGKYYHNPNSPFSFRDVIHLYDKHGVVNKSESSYVRYPTVFHYPLELYTKEYDIFQSYFMSELDIPNDKLGYFDNWLTSYLKSYQGITERYQHLSKIWRIMSKSKLIRVIVQSFYVRLTESHDGVKESHETDPILNIINNHALHLSVDLSK